MRRWLVVVVLVLVAGCGAEAAPDGAEPSRTAAATSPATSATSPPPPTRAPSTRTPSPTPSSEPEPVLGVDLSHHQGTVDWPSVAGAGMAFAYLKATEGSTYTDPTFATNADGAARSGLRVGGYHYFNLCAPGAPQGEHFAAVLDDVLAGVPPRRRMPPALDLEILGSCDTPPPRAELLREVRAFLALVEPATGQRVVVYAFPEFERTYGFADEIDRRQWVRRLGDRPPRRAWWLWQKSQSASVDGVAGPVDLNELRAD